MNNRKVISTVAAVMLAISAGVAGAFLVMSGIPQHQEMKPTPVRPQKTEAVSAPGVDTDGKIFPECIRYLDASCCPSSHEGHVVCSDKMQLESLLDSIRGMIPGTWFRTQLIEKLKEVELQDEHDYALLMKCLNEQDIELSRAVINLIGERGYTGANDKLRELVWQIPQHDMLGQDFTMYSYIIGMDAANALAKLGDKMAIPVIVQAIVHGKGYGFDLSNVLARFGAPAIEEVMKVLPSLIDGRERRNLLQAIAAIHDQSAMEELQRLVATTSSGDVFVAASQAIVAMGSRPNIEVSLSKVTSSDPEVRAQVARNLAGENDARALPVLVGLLNSDESEIVRLEAAQAISHSAVSDATEILVARLEVEKAEKVKRAVVSSIAKSIEFSGSSQRAVEVLTRLLENEEEPLTFRMECAYVLHQITGDSRYMEMHEELLKKMVPVKFELQKHEME